MYASDNPNVPEGFSRGGVRYVKDNGVYTVFHAAHEDAHNMPNILKALQKLMDDGVITNSDLNEYARVRAENIARVRGAQPAATEDWQQLRKEFACDLFGAVMYASQTGDGTIYERIGVSQRVGDRVSDAIENTLAYEHEVEHNLDVELSENAEAAGAVETVFSDNAIHQRTLVDYNNKTERDRLLSEKQRDMMSRGVY